MIKKRSIEKTSKGDTTRKQIGRKTPAQTIETEV